MKNKKTTALLFVYSLFLTCLLLLWPGCTNEEIIGKGNNDGNTATITLSLSPAPAITGDNEPETKSETGQEIAPEANELMYSATVFVCDETGTIMAKASVGNLGNKSEHSFPDEIELKANEYKIYGFANCEYLKELKDILQLSVGNTLPTTVTDNTLIIDDPAGQIDLKNGKYIPMTGSSQVTVTRSTKTLSVTVDRLVCKAKFRITYPDGQTDAEKITLDSLALKGNRKSVPLFSKGNEHDPGKLGEDINLLPLIPNGQTVFESGADVKLANLYLNESPLRNPYNLIMKVKEDQDEGQDDVFRYGTFNRRMTRNHVRPITIEIRNIKLAINGKYYNNPIGAVLEGVEFGTNYTLEMQEGSTFDLKLHLRSRGKNVTTERIENVTWTHIFKGKGWLLDPPAVSEETIDGDLVSRYSLKGAVPANNQGDGEAQLDITVAYHDKVYDKDRPDYKRELNFTLYIRRTPLSPDRNPFTKSLLQGFCREEIIEM